MVISLNPFPFLTNAVTNSVTNIFGDIWAFLLFNIITPVLIIVFIVLFFGGQYLLLKFYAYILENFFSKILNVFKVFSQSPQYSKIVKFYTDALK